jgi:hypothetical protein
LERKVEEIWEIKVARRIRQSPQNRQEQKKTQKRKNKETFHFLEIIRHRFELTKTEKFQGHHT